METVTDFLFLGSKITADSNCSHEIKRRLLLGRKAMTNLDRVLKSRDITAKKRVSSQCYGFSSSHVWMWELDYKESWVLSFWCFELVLEKTLESPLDFKEIQPVHSKGDQPWVKLNIQKMKIMASSPIIAWQIDGKTMEIITDFLFLGSKITADGDCSHEIKRWLLLGPT